MNSQRLRTCLASVLLIFCINGSLACLSSPSLQYRNYWVELYSTTPCGDVGKTPLGVCSASCGAMNGLNMGSYNCPAHASTCCRPLAYCDATSVAQNLLWESEDYEVSHQSEPSTCSLNVVSARDTCYLRVDFLDMDVQSTTVDGCSYSYVQINNQAQGDGQKICGTLNHKSTLVKVGKNLIGMSNPITLNLHMDHVPHKYSARVSQVKCDEVRTFRSQSRSSRTLGAPDLSRERQQLRKKSEDLPYMGRMYAVAYTRHPLIRSCPVTFLSKDVVIGSASCSMRLGGPGTSKGLMVVHGSLHEDPKDFPLSIGEMARYVAANGVVVKSSVFHPMYNHETNADDIAVYFLNRTIEDVVPVDLPVPVDEFVDLSVYMSRYHYKKVSHDVTVMHSPEEKLTKIVPNSACTNSVPKVALVTSNDTICLDVTPREDSPCEGEIGSSVVHVGSTGRVTLVGLMMGNYHHCEGEHSYQEPALKLINYLEFIDVATSPTAKVAHPSAEDEEDEESAVSTNTVESSSGSSSPSWYNRLFDFMD